jgi:S-layer protein (TIGR01567 family)
MKFKSSEIRCAIRIVGIIELVFLLLAYAAQAAAPVSSPESRFVWEPGDNLTFTWTNENFDGFYYDVKNRAGNESLTITLDNLEDRSIPKDGIVYSTTVVNVPFNYRPFGNYSMIGFMGDRYFAGYTSGSRIARFPVTLVNRSLLSKILLDENKVQILSNESNLTLNEKYVLKIKALNITEATIQVILEKFGGEIDRRIIKIGDTYVFEKDIREVIYQNNNIYYEFTPGKIPIIAVHIDSVFGDEDGETRVVIKGIFQLSDVYTWVDLGYGMKITKVSDTGITMSYIFYPVYLERCSIIDIIGNIKLKVADSNTFRLHLYGDRYEKHEHRGAAGSNNLTAWDGLNYAGFLYDANSGNYSESLVITNLTGRRIPGGGLAYTSYTRRVTYAVTKVTGQQIPGTDGSYVSFSLGGKKYTERNNGYAELLIAQGEMMAHEGRSFEKKLLSVGPNEFIDDIWELGEGYTLTAPSINWGEPRKARLVLKRNGVELDDVWLSGGNTYRYFQPGENVTPKFITYLDSVFTSHSSEGVIQLRYTWFVSDNVTQIKEGDRLGVFNVTVVEPDRLVLKNRAPIELKAGRIINLYGNLSFFVENSDELRFYPTDMAGTQVMSKEITENEVPDNISDVTTSVGTSPVAGRTEKTAGFEAVLSIMIILAVYITGKRRW